MIPSTAPSNRLVHLRLERHLTQDQLSEATGIPQSVLSQYENGRRVPGMRNAGRIAAALHATLDELGFDFSGSEP